MDSIISLSAGESQQWQATTLDQIGKLEEFLEDVLAENPSLLQLESRRTGIRGPFAIFRQLSFDTPQGRSIRPDIVILSESGHVVIVEVKRFINPELKDRRVIAQTVDYAASLAALNEKEILNLFVPDNSFQHWFEFIQDKFPASFNPEELAEELMEKFNSGSLNLIIACDKVAPGLNELIKGVAVQSALGFDLSVVEIHPYIKKSGNNADEVIFVPSTKLATEIVARTVVTVNYSRTENKPSVEVKTSSIEEIEETIKSVSSGGRKSIQWDEVSFNNEMKELGGDDEVAIADRFRNWSRQNKFIEKWPKAVNAQCQLILRHEDQELRLFDLIAEPSGGKLWIRFPAIGQSNYYLDKDRRQELVDKIIAIKGVNISKDSANNHRGIPFSDLIENDSLQQLTEVFQEIVKNISGIN